MVWNCLTICISLTIYASNEDGGAMLILLYRKVTSDEQASDQRFDHASFWGTVSLVMLESPLITVIVCPHSQWQVWEVKPAFVYGQFWKKKGTWIFLRQLVNVENIDFETMWDFPNCVGAIDGKHLVMQAPSRSGSRYFNYEKTH